MQLPVNIADITASKLRYAQTLQWPNSLGSISSGINLWPSYRRKSVETYFCLIFVLKMFKTSSQVELGASLALILCLSNLKLKTVFFHTTVSFFSLFVSSTFHLAGCSNYLFLISRRKKKFSIYWSNVKLTKMLPSI